MIFLRFLFLFLSMSSLICAQTLPIPTPTSTVLSTNAPKIYCANPNFDFHNVDEGGDITHLFKIVNRGKTTLIINHVATSCGCTAAVEDKKEIQLGGQGIITATYHTKGRPGHATKVITVSSNDPVNPNYQMNLDMTVVREIDVQPDKIYLYNVQHGQAQTTPVKITGKPLLPLKILSAQSTNGSVTVGGIIPFSDQATGLYGATLQVSVPATQPIGNFTDTLKVQTNDKKKPELDIDVQGEVVGKFSYGPHLVYFMPHQNNPVTVTFSAQDPQHFTIQRVESVHHLAQPETKKINRGGGFEQYQVLIHPPNNLPTDSDGKDTILVTTNDSEQPQVTIDVQVTK